jgi:hypothetical protein
VEDNIESSIFQDGGFSYIIKKRNLPKYVKSPFYPLDYILSQIVMRIDYSLHKKSEPIMLYRRLLTSTLFTLTLLSLSISFLLSWPLATSFAQLSSSSPAMPLTQEGADQLAELEASRQQYLSVWNNTPFTSQFDVFVAEGTHLGYGIYREHVPANVFRPGETIVLYVEPVGFGHQPITDDTSTPDGGNNSSTTSRTLYLINMTADYILSDSSGTELVTIEDLPAANLVSNRQNTEFSLTLTLSQEEPFPVGDYIVTYVVHDQVTGQSFEIDKTITIDDDANTGALPLPDSNENNNSMQQLIPQGQLEQRRSQALEP